MECRPLGSDKRIMTGIKTIVMWIDTKTGGYHSFNDQPSYVYGDNLYWHENGELHRGYIKPAAIVGDKDGYQGWCVNGKLIKRVDFDGTITLY